VAHSTGWRRSSSSESAAGPSGFGAPHTKIERKAVSETLKHMQPQDLLKSGIPEFIGAFRSSSPASP